LNIISVAYASNSEGEIAIVFLADVSGSVNSADAEGYWVDAVSLGIDLAPENSEVAFFAINNAVVAQTEFYDVSIRSYRNSLMQVVQSTQVRGSTDFNAGLYAALSLFETVPDKERHLFVVADISEAGFLCQHRSINESIEKLTELTQQFAYNEIKVHLLFLETATQNQEVMPLWTELAYKTGGSEIFVDKPQNLPQVVQSLYFSLFEYNKSFSTVVNTRDVSMEIPIELPDFEADRVRVHIISAEPMEGIQFRADGGQVSFNESRLYYMIELKDEKPEALTIVLPSNDNIEITIFTIIDGAIPETEPEIEEDYPEPEPEIITLPDEPTPLVEYPEHDYTLCIAIAVGGALILLAIIIAICKRRRKRRPAHIYEPPPTVHPVIVPMQSGSTPAEIGEKFSGKLDIYGILIEGGATEIPATSVRLDRFGEQQPITLYDAFELAGIPYHYAEAQRILLLPGKNDTLIIKNNSSAVVYCGGQARLRGQQAVLAYGQKIVVIYEDSMNEYQIYYHNVLDKVSSGTVLHISLDDDKNKKTERTD